MVDPADVAASEQPQWFRVALSAAVEIGEVEVDRTPIRFRAWGDPGAAGMVLVHGGAAHSRWWDHVAPLLASAGAGFRVVAPDLSGHGDSGFRSDYHLEQWAAEVLAVAETARAWPRPIVIGHSMGGMVALLAAARGADQFSGVVAVDTPIRDRPPDAAIWQRGQLTPRAYRTRAQAEARFRPLPPPPEGLQYVLAHLAETSVRPVTGGWSWKVDPQAFQRRAIAASELKGLNCDIVLLRAEYGLVSGDMCARVATELGREVPVVEIPHATHQVLIDQPLALIAALRTLLAVWPTDQQYRATLQLKHFAPNLCG